MENEKTMAEVEKEINKGFRRVFKKIRFIGSKTPMIIVAVIIALFIILGALIYVYRGLFIAATVDGDFITRLSIIRQLEKASGKNLLESLIEQKLIESEVNARKITVSEEEINEEIKKIENQLSFQGTDINTALAGQNMTMEELRGRIMVFKKTEKLIADKINVTDEEVAKYIKDNQIAVPAGQEALANEQIKNQLKNQKMDTETKAFLAELKAKAKIRYFVNY